MGLVDMHGRDIHARERKLTKAQAGAIITSEIDLAIDKWNERVRTTNMMNDYDLHIFEIKFDRFEYSEEVKIKSELFGYAKLSIVCKHQDKVAEVYSKGVNFKKESELDNTNGYYPDMVVDCMGFLISSGLMYNLAILAETAQNEPKEPKNATKIGKPGTGTKGKPGNRNTGGSGK